MNLPDSSQAFLANLTRALANIQVDLPAHLDHGTRVFLLGNGGSQAVAAHITNDLVKQRIRAMCLSDPTTLTCLANDIGYDDAYAHQIRVQASAGDVVVCISSSGRSENLLKAARTGHSVCCTVITLTGFEPDNRLRKLGNSNYYVPSSDYGIVEVAHLAILHAMVSASVGAV